MSCLIETLEPRNFLSASPTGIAAIATFVNGAGKTQPDQYPGIAGGGWLGGWKRSTKALSGSVVSTSPVDLIEPNHLAVQTSASGTISRPFSGTAGTTDRVIQFNYRYDGVTRTPNRGDFLTIFGDNAGETALDSPGSASPKGNTRTNTWSIKGFVRQRKTVWQFGYLNHKGAISFINDQVNGAGVGAGHVYQFTINEHLADAVGTYQAIVRDTSSGTTYKSPVLKFAAGETSTDSLNFGISLAKGETGKFSVDAIHVATKSTVAPAVFLIGGLYDTQHPVTGMTSVQQHFGPDLEYSGIDTSQIHWYEENYDQDTSVNPNHDTIAAEIDQVPLGTPVVLMGTSFGGDQAIISASQASRPIDYMILYDPVLQTDFSHQTTHTSSDPNQDQPQQLTFTPASNVKVALDLGKVLFQSNGKIYPDGPYGFTIPDRAGVYENLYFPRYTWHEDGQFTPRQKWTGPGPNGDPINNTAEYVENAMDGFPLFWDGWKSGA